MAHRPTHEQRSAADPRHCVWVTANAGTGKTRILTDRVLRSMLDGTPPHKILCLTFTKAAAAEMKERIFDALSDWAIADSSSLHHQLESFLDSAPTQEQVTLARQLFMKVIDSPEDFKVQTIHGFCQSILRRFPLEAHVAPYFSLIEPGQSDEIIASIRRSIFSYGNTENAEKTSNILSRAIDIVTRYSTDTTLISTAIPHMISRREVFYEALQSYRTDADPEGKKGMVDSIYQYLGVERGIVNEEVLYRWIQENFPIDIHGLRQVAAAMITHGSDAKKREGEFLAEWLNNNRAHIFYPKFVKADGGLRSVSGFITKNIAKKSPDVENILSAEFSRIEQVTEYQSATKTAWLTEALIDIASMINLQYDAVKKENGYLDYNDLISCTGKLLSDKSVASWVMYKLDEGIDHIMVDEAQDTSPQQWQIIRGLCEEFFSGQGKAERERTIFVVGDEKQSIYSFQGADPVVFKDMHYFFEKQVQNAQKEWKSIPLSLSFRSTEAVLEVVDAVFSYDESIQRSVSEIADNIRHQTSRVSQLGRVELWPLRKGAGRAKNVSMPIEWQLPQERQDKSDPKALLAEDIANEIKNWLDSKRWLPAKKRAVTAGDIMVLIRTRGPFVQQLIRALQREGVPVNGVDRMILTDHLAIKDLLSLVQFLLLPSDDLKLAELLKSPLIGGDDDALFSLAWNRGKKTLWQSIEEQAEQCKESKRIFTYLSSLNSQFNKLGVLDFFMYVLDVAGGRKNFILRMGKEVEDPLNEFINLCYLFEQQNPPSLQQFLRWLRLRSAEVKRDMEKIDDAVRILTVHASKGLQAPVVFLPDTTSIPDGRKLDILWDNNSQILLWPGSKNNRSSHFKALREERLNEERKEYLRLLYVAMTRAEDELYICGWSSNDVVGENSWYDLCRKIMRDIGKKMHVVQGNQGVDSEKVAVEGWFYGYDIEEFQGKSEDLCDNKPLLPLSLSQLPDFVHAMPPEEPVPTNPLRPSALDSDVPALSPLSEVPDVRFRKGVIIHTLLQWLPEVEEEKRQERIENYLTVSHPYLSKGECESIKKQVISVLTNEKLYDLFALGSLAEVPVSGCIGAIPVVGQIDRMVVREHDVLVLDYKTNQKPPKTFSTIPSAYIRQMSLYRQLLLDIYPNKTIHCALFWTETLSYMEIPAEVL